jgi:hypothetical protein
LVGNQSQPGVIEESFATGRVEGTGFGVGGLVGTFFGGTIADSYATSEDVVYDFAGGLVGLISINNGGTEFDITNCYAASTVSGDAAGLLVGSIDGDADYTITNSYYLAMSVDAGALALGTALSESEMSMQDSFEEWDFDEVWQFDSAISDYPTLQFQ